MLDDDDDTGPEKLLAIVIIGMNMLKLVALSVLVCGTMGRRGRERVWKHSFATALLLRRSRNPHAVRIQTSVSWAVCCLTSDNWSLMLIFRTTRNEPYGSRSVDGRTMAVASGIDRLHGLASF